MLIHLENNEYVDKLQAHSILRVINTKETLVQLRKHENKAECVQLSSYRRTFNNLFTPIRFLLINCVKAPFILISAGPLRN